MTAKPARFVGRRIWVASLSLGGAALAAWLLLRPGSGSAPVPETPLASLVLQDSLLLDAATRQPFTGVVVEAYPDGSPRSRSSVSAGKIDGLSEGWFTNGVRQVEERFVAGVAHGLRTKWHPNGVKASEAQIVSGQIEGVFRRWHENGALAEEITLKAGVPQGPSRAYYASGFLKASAEMVDGKVSKQKFWNDGEQPAEGFLAAAHP